MSLGTTNWGLQASVPVRNPADMVFIELLDATPFAGQKTAPYARELGGVCSKPLARCGVRIANLTDGHISKGNELGLDGMGGKLFAILHMVRAGQSMQKSEAEADTD